jgi:DNA-binding CsgD family transcriptional regulator
MSFFGFIEQSNKSRTKDQLVHHFEQALYDFDIDGFVYSLARGSFASGNKMHFGVAGSYPREWMEYYRKQGYVENDPTFRQIARTKGFFTWKDLQSIQSMTPKEQQVMNEAEEAGLKNGISLSIHGPYGEVLGLGFVSSSNRKGLSINESSVLYALANQFHLAYASLDKLPAAAPLLKLTDRQKEILQWTAAGKSRSTISEIMNISESTVDDHFRQIFRKLGCNDRILAVLKAVQLGLVTV